MPAWTAGRTQLMSGSGVFRELAVALVLYDVRPAPRGLGQGDGDGDLPDLELGEGDRCLLEQTDSDGEPLELGHGTGGPDPRDANDGDGDLVGHEHVTLASGGNCGQGTTDPENWAEPPERDDARVLAPLAGPAIPPAPSAGCTSSALARTCLNVLGEPAGGETLMAADIPTDGCT